MEIKKALKDHILTDRGGHRNSLADDEPLIESEIIDSLGILKLIAFIEEKFKVTIPDEELIPENFETITDIASLIERKLKAS